MGIYTALRELCFGKRRIPMSRPAIVAGKSKKAARGSRQFQVESLEPRRFLAANSLVPEVLLGSVYFEEATGDDSQPDIIQVSFVGGAAGTKMNRLIINGDKREDGLTDGDIFFDTAAGGLGAFQHGGLSIQSANGFTVNKVTVVDGGSQIIFDLSGFDAGEKLVFAVDADEAQYVDPSTPGSVDANSLVEGAEFQRTILVGEFSAPDYVNLTLKGIHWDAYDTNFAAAQTATGLKLSLPNDTYSTQHDFTDRTAGAIAHAPQIPLATLSGYVYHDKSDDGAFNTGTEQGIGGVTLELIDSSGNATGITTTTSSDPSNRGFYEFRQLFPGTYGVREVQPNGWLDGKDTAGDHGGTATNDRIFGAVLDFGDHGLNYNFGELLPGSIRGTVHADEGPDCDFDHPDIRLEGVRIDLLDGSGNLIRFTTTDANGDYAFTGLAPGIYRVREHQPTNYYDGGERVGTAGGVASDVVGTYSIIADINITSDLHAIQYDFCEKVGVMLSGYVYHDRSNDGVYNRTGANPETPISGVVMKLFNGAGQDTGLRATTDASGFYKFTNLAAGTYAVVEVQPAGWFDGIDTPGNLGGTADASPPGDAIRQIVMTWGRNGVEYNFGELLPASIHGTIHADSGPDCDFDHPDVLLEGVTVDLLDVSGNVVGTTTTDAQGNYAFTGLRPGTYTVREHQPTNYFDGGERVGSAGGVASDIGNTYSIIAAISLGSGVNAVQYDFCEKLPSSIRGRVHADSHGDCDFDDPDIMLSGVKIELLNAQGQVVATTLTDVKGEYSFTGLKFGEYQVRESNPAGYYDGGERVGSAGGVASDVGSWSIIAGIIVDPGENAIQYDFCEKLPSTISGRVHADTHEDCDFDDPDVLLSGVKIELLDKNGNVVATTTTDAKGEYHFTNLKFGEYQVREIQPIGYYDGGERVGSVGGLLDGINTIYAIQLPAGTDAVQYDFCEKVGVVISGYVYHDRSNDGVYNRTTSNAETPIASVIMKLLDGGGNDTGLRATTDANGYYQFTNLQAGTYAVMEIHPAGWFDGIDTPGNLGGTADPSPPGDMIRQIKIKYGQAGVEYNFGELLPGSIRGQVVVSTDPDCDPDDGEPGIANVQIDLLNAGGLVIATTHTNSNGEYQFTNLRPGIYGVREHQPSAYFDLDSHVGSHGGVHVSTNELGTIPIGSGQALTDYDFCEEPPARLSGYVYIEGAPIPNAEVFTPEHIADIRPGYRTADDHRLAGVTLMLFDVETGLPVTADRALPGAYALGAITTITDASGFYQFTNLKAGVYAVVEVQPNGMVDGFDHAGTTGGYAVNPNDLLVGAITPEARIAIDKFRDEQGENAIVLIRLVPNGHSQENNFSELVIAPPIQPPPPLLPPDLPPPPEPPKPVLLQAVKAPPQPFLFPLIPTPYRRPEGIRNAASGFTWHLSVINAGWPREMQANEAQIQFTAASVQSWQNIPLNQGHWTLARIYMDQVQVIRDVDFGNEDGKPVVGDFNGDGTSDLAIFVKGQWFIDLNGDGRWDATDDLWAKLGTEADRPVTGDWDADGKDDIGIYGPAWLRDPLAIAREPGLPDAVNYPTMPVDKFKNVPPREDDATSSGRLLKRTTQGRARFDRIDHVFHYGTPTDTPVTGDWNGDGVRQIGVFSGGQWNLDTNGDGRFTAEDKKVAFGQLSDLPVVGDFNGDGIDEIGVYRAGRWIIDTNHNGQVDTQDKVFELGGPDDKPVVGDWNDDGIDDPGVYHSQTQPTPQVARKAG